MRVQRDDGGLPHDALSRPCAEPPAADEGEAGGAGFEQLLLLCAAAAAGPVAQPDVAAPAPQGEDCPADARPPADDAVYAVAHAASRDRAACGAALAASVARAPANAPLAGAADAEVPPDARA
ncbi:MAG: hypothetical protein AB1689_06840, partial [Thermodesulfobacteriota bacterium]